MFDYKTSEPRGEQPTNRRQFLYSLGSLFSAGTLLGLFGGPLFQLRHNSYQKALLRRSLTGGPITVYKMVPLPGVRYNKAETRHMANKIFPSIEAAKSHRPHRGFLYGLKPIHLAAAVVNGRDAYALFGNRKDFDQRVLSDRLHWQRLGIKQSAVFGIVKNA